MPGTGSNPILPNPLSSGPINLSIKVPEASPVGTTLGVNVTLTVPTYMQMFNSASDDIESTQTQTFCNCYALSSGGQVQPDRAFCGSGDIPFSQPNKWWWFWWRNSLSMATIDFGSSGQIFQGATNETYDAPSVSATTSIAGKPNAICVATG
ncbi:MAG: hypothetical protein HWD58_12010 [Bacteroidota bacterium]|nr:MAG: hypothetical protein HWD58_12010 [Bacteroidota bacterium]